MNDSPTYLTEKELAARWRISHTTLRTRRARGIAGLPYVKVLGSIRYDLSDVTAHERAGRHL